MEEEEEERERQKIVGAVEYRTPSASVFVSLSPPLPSLASERTLQSRSQTTKTHKKKRERDPFPYSI